jgi:hypothetical protein
MSALEGVMHWVMHGGNALVKSRMNTSFFLVIVY